MVTDLRAAGRVAPPVAPAPFTYRVVLDELTPELATFTWTPRDVDPAGRVPAVVAVPRADWEHMARPGSLDVEVRPTGEAPR